MVLLNLYGIIEPTIISEKLGVGICNLAPDWVVGMNDDFTEEIMEFNHRLDSYRKDGFDVSWGDSHFDLEKIVKHLGWQENDKNASQIIAEHLIEIQVMDFENSLLQIKNSYMHSPTCEPQYTKKLLNFCIRVQEAQSAKMHIPNQIPLSIYDSDDLGSKPQILMRVESLVQMNKKRGFSLESYTNGCIQSLKNVGKLIDEFLVTEDDFWKLDYIINAVFFDDSFNAYHIFKTMSLIEMLIINPKGNGSTKGEIEEKLPRFLPDRIPNESTALFSSIARKLRNKIGHGDFRAVQQLLEEYRESFMRDFWYDEYENSIETWTYGDICLMLDAALNEILWTMLSDKNKLLALRKG